ncbi:unnamed protein product [Allacma fusca]|uniref:Uncharacterized protein n=1 Tax=Allacma fusca TaxID=39272 RepID=A0A8J2KVA2_9HEXA|nr:unnamed protein product [Allacma fusca]
MVLSCCACSYQAGTFARLWEHYTRKHRLDTNLSIRCSQHATSFKTVQDFKNHGTIFHHLKVHEFDKILGADTDNDEHDSINGITKDTLLFLLELESKFQLGQVGLQFVLENLVTIMNKGKERQENVDMKIIGTEYKRRRLLVKRYGLLEPQPVTLGMTRKKKRFRLQRIFGIRQNYAHFSNASKYLFEQKPDLGYIIPLRNLLDMLLRIPQYEECCNSTGDQELAKKKGVYVSDPLDAIRTIYLAISTDEIEVVNPIGMNTKKHKVTIGCVEVLNLPPQYRSALQAKHLLFVAKSMHLKNDHGLFAILDEFVRTLNYGAVGIPLGKSNQLYKLKLMYATGDSPANAFLFGFKEAVGPAIKFCRTCNISRGDISATFNDQRYEMRTLEGHRQSLVEIEQADVLQRVSLQKATGIIRRSPLFDIHDISMRTGVHDIMHVLLEGGVLACGMQWFLNYIVKVKSRLTLNQLKQIVLSWNYNDCDTRNKPRKLDERIVNPKAKVNMTALSLYVLAQELLFMLEPFLEPEDEPYIINFSQILYISHFFLSSTTYTDESIQTLRYLIARYLHDYQILYPLAKLKPKHHFLTHFLQMILDFGPTRHLSCLRFEAKYGLFKIRKWRNFLNVPYSLASFHQKWLLSKIISSDGLPRDKFVYYEATTLHSVKFNSVIIPTRFRSLLAHDYDDIIEKIAFGSHTLKQNSVLEISNVTDEIPEFCKLFGVLRKGDELHALVDVYLEANFMPEVCAYKMAVKALKKLLEDPSRGLKSNMTTN